MPGFFSLRQSALRNRSRKRSSYCLKTLCLSSSCFSRIALPRSFSAAANNCSILRDVASSIFGGPVDRSVFSYFSFTTLTTTGYGNLVPAGNPGQTLAVSEMILGQLFLITALGKIVTAWRPARWTASDPPG